MTIRGCFVINFLLYMTVAVSASELPRFSVVRAQCIPSQPVPHMAVYHDCEITLAITNTLDRSIVVYGSEFDQNFDPGKYRLFYNEESQTWEYPTSTKTAAKWESVSSRFKKERRLRPGESLEFSVTLSSNADKGRRFRMTAYVNLSGKGNPLEIVSDEFSSVSCKE